LNSSGTPQITIQDISSFFPGFKIVDIANPFHKSLYDLSSKHSQGRARFGDLNIDGYPDLFMTLLLEDSAGTNKYEPLILMS